MFNIFKWQPKLHQLKNGDWVYLDEVQYILPINSHENSGNGVLGRPRVDVRTKKYIHPCWFTEDDEAYKYADDLAKLVNQKKG